VAAVYPTFTYGDEPGRWVATASGELRASTDEHRRTLWKQLEGAAGAPWFLGERSSVIDVYVSVMSRWRPGRAWFAEHCPRLHAIARATDARPELAAVWKANFEA
jgi:GST-like protein